jgi:carbon-monoxide dehydrogenase medium subunit
VITTSSIIKLHAQALAEASGLIGGPQVRNVATLGGNVAHALPAADGTIALFALNARVEIATMEGRRYVSLDDLFKGPGVSALDPERELLVGFYLPEKGPGEGSAFNRIMRPQGVAIAILNCAVWVQRSGNLITDIRVAIGPSGPTPRRLTEVEDVLRGKTPGDDEIEAALQVLLEHVHFRTSRHRATQAYREEMARVLLHDTLRQAWERAEE